MKDVCYIIGAGDFTGINDILEDKMLSAQQEGLYESMENSFQPKRLATYVIAVDGGYEYTKKLGIIPDMILGDFDSLGYIPKESNIIIHQPEKDDTDMALALNEGIKLGYKEFMILGGMGGRLDHTIANMQLINFASKQGKYAYLIGEKETITAVTNGAIRFPSTCEGLFSVVTFDGKVNGVSIEGAKYGLNHYTMTSDIPIGISNEFIGKDAVISVTDGTIIIVWQTQKDIMDKIKRF